MSLSIAAVGITTRQISRFFRTPKGLTLGIFAALGLLAMSTQDADVALGNLLVAMATAAALDVAVVRLRHNEWTFPDGALLTALIVGFILRTQESWLAIAFTSALAILVKHAFRTRWSNVFNPAAAGLVASGFVLHTGQSWWGAMPDLGILGVIVLIGAGAYIADRLNKLPMLLVFLTAYFLLFAVAGFFSHASMTAEVFRAPDLQAVLFFAFFMLDDPPTSPVRYEDQVVYGLIAATAAYFLLMMYGVEYFLAGGLLIANLWESLRRIVLSRSRGSSRGLPAR